MDKLLERFLHYVSLDTQSKSGVTGRNCRLWACRVLISLPADITIMVNMSL